MPFAPNGPVGSGHLDDERLDLGHALRVRDRVVEERARQEAPVLVVVELLEERPADALRRHPPRIWPSTSAGFSARPTSCAITCRKQLSPRPSRGRRARGRGGRPPTARRSSGPTRRVPRSARSGRRSGAPSDASSSTVIGSIGSSDGADDAVHDLEVVGRDLELLGRGGEQLLRALLRLPAARPRPRCT